VDVKQTAIGKRHSEKHLAQLYNNCLTAKSFHENHIYMHARGKREWVNLKHWARILPDVHRQVSTPWLHCRALSWACLSAGTEDRPDGPTASQQSALPASVDTSVNIPTASTAQRVRYSHYHQLYLYVPATRCRNCYAYNWELVAWHSG